MHITDILQPYIFFPLRIVYYILYSTYIGAEVEQTKVRVLLFFNKIVSLKSSGRAKVYMIFRKIHKNKYGCGEKRNK